MKQAKDLIEPVLTIIAICIGISFCFSFMRAIGHDQCTWDSGNKTCPNTPCEPFYIDKLEPLVSTRWFCEVKK